MIAPLSLIHDLVNSHIDTYPSVTGAHRPITLFSIAEFAGTLLWAWMLLLSFAGWGRASARLLRIRSVPACVACAAGIATLIFIAGLLNLAGLITRALLFGLVAVGIASYLLFRRSQPEASPWRSIWRQSSTASRVLFLVAFLLLAFRVAGTVRLAAFDVSDDSAAYLALPQKMLETHRLAPDPFSERRITSTLGGGYFLQDLVLAATSLAHVGMADRTLGAILLAGILPELGTLFELSAFQIALLEFLVFLVPQETFNLTYIVLPVPLLLSMVWLLAMASRTKEPQNQPSKFRVPVGYAILAGMVGAAAITLKSTYLPFVGALSLVPLILFFLRRKPRVAVQACIATICGILLVLLAWMLAMKWTSGTYLFPILGRGLDYTRLNLFPADPRFASHRSFVKVFIQGAGLVLLAGILFFTRRKLPFAAFSILTILSSAAAITALNYASSADSIWRYNFPQFFTAVIVFYASAAAIAAHTGSSLKPRVTFCMGILAVTAMIFFYDIPGNTIEPLRVFTAQMTNVEPIIASLSARQLSSARLRDQYRNVEAAIPTNGISLENVAYSFLLDYSKRKIFIMDWPGAAAPLPGWPFGKNTDELAQYLKANSIRYIIFDDSYAQQSGAGICQDLIGNYRFSQWLKQQLWMNLLAVTQLQQLQSRFHLIYDDGSIAVIDLDAPLSTMSRVKQPLWGINANLNVVCSPVAIRYFTNHPASENTGPHQF
jgi:hypothetical protein